MTSKICLLISLLILSFQIYAQTAKFPIVDSHTHITEMPYENLLTYIETMKENNIMALVNVSGRGYGAVTLKNGQIKYAPLDGQHLKAAVANAQKNNINNILVFTNLDYEGLGEKTWASNAVANLKKDVKNGARGLKIYSRLGIKVNDHKGRRVAINDSRLDPIWKAASELKIPVLIHSSKSRQQWDTRKTTLSWQDLIDEQHNLFKKHPKTVFINAHLGWHNHQLKKLGKLLERLPNVYVDIAGVLDQIHITQAATQKWFEQYQDRILFGTDGWDPSSYKYYVSILENKDKLNLSDIALKKIYHENALKIIPGLNL